MWGPSEFTTTGSLKGADLLPRLHEITVPALLICGEHDEASPETILKYRDALAQGEVAVIPDASHCHRSQAAQWSRPGLTITFHSAPRLS